MRKKKIYTFDEGYEIIEKLLGYTKDVSMDLRM